MCNCRVTSPKQIIEKIEYKIFRAVNDGSTPGFSILFQHALESWLQGVGHPNHPDVRDGTLLPPGAFEKEADNITFRAEAFLLAATESYLLPHKPIQVCQTYVLCCFCFSLIPSSKVRIMGLDTHGPSRNDPEGTSNPSSSSRVSHYCFSCAFLC
jgi:hypothetical protein